MSNRRLLFAVTDMHQNDQAPNSFLHSRSSIVLTRLMDVILSLPLSRSSISPEILYHALTALAQHVPNAESFAPILNLVVEGTRTILKELAADRDGADDYAWDRLAVGLKAISAIVGVKKGGRVASELFQLTPMYPHV